MSTDRVALCTCCQVHIKQVLADGAGCVKIGMCRSFGKHDAGYYTTAETHSPPLAFSVEAVNSGKISFKPGRFHMDSFHKAQFKVPACSVQLCYSCIFGYACVCGAAETLSGQASKEFTRPGNAAFKQALLHRGSQQVAAGFRRLCEHGGEHPTKGPAGGNN